MTLNKWLIYTALLFGSLQAKATVTTAVPAVQSSQTIERTLQYGDQLSEQYPQDNLVLTIDENTLTERQAMQLRRELTLFESYKLQQVPQSALRNLQYVECVPCGPPPGRRSNRVNSYKSNNAGNVGEGG